MVPEIWSTTDIILCYSGLLFALEKQNFEKIKKKTPEDIIILQMCTINDNYMMYGS